MPLQSARISVLRCNCVLRSTQRQFTGQCAARGRWQGRTGFRNVIFCRWYDRGYCFVLIIGRWDSIGRNNWRERRLWFVLLLSHYWWASHRWLMWYRFESWRWRNVTQLLRGRAELQVRTGVLNGSIWPDQSNISQFFTTHQLYN